MTYDAIIIGGGPGGASLAAHLARAGQQTLLLEKRRLPASKLCGEFLSPEVTSSLRRLGVWEAVRAAGAHPVRRVRLTAASGAAFESPLPEVEGAGKKTALGLSRRCLDELLFDNAYRTGATVHDATKVRAVHGGLAEGFSVETDEGECFSGRVVFGAYGRRGILDRKLERSFMNAEAPLVAFKAHYDGRRLEGALDNTIEVHSFPGGYCGLTQVEARAVNACWIARTHVLKEAGSPEAMVETALAQNPILASRMRAMERRDETFEATSQVSLQAKGCFADDVCMVGDAAGMIAPLCGDGMAMALHASELAAPPALAFLEEQCTAAQFRRRYERRWRRTFGTRLRLGRLAHRSGLRPGLAAAVVHTFRWAPSLGRWFIRKTRG